MVPVWCRLYDCSRQASVYTLQIMKDRSVIYMQCNMQTFTDAGCTQERERNRERFQAMVTLHSAALQLQDGQNRKSDQVHWDN